jgi:3-hydroxyisobutyrate dehydrogenase
MNAADYTPNFLLRLMAKDLDYSIQEAGKLSIHLATAQAALDIFQRAVGAGHGEKDIAAAVELVRAEKGR